MDQAPASRDETQSEIREVLRKRRETLDRVRSDLDKVEKLQQKFESQNGPNASPGIDLSHSGKPMRCRQKLAKAGDRLPVKHCHSYALPPGLAEGTVVKLVSFDRGFWTVEKNGRRFEKVFVSSVKAGWLYELDGRWLDEKDPEIIAARRGL